MASSSSTAARLEFDDVEVEYLRTAAEVYACGRCGSAECSGKCQNTAEWLSNSPLLAETGELLANAGMGDSQSTIGGGGNTTGTTSSEDLVEEQQEEGPLATLKMSLFSPPQSCETSMTSEGSAEPKESEVVFVDGSKPDEEVHQSEKRKVSHVTSRGSSATVLTEPTSEFTTVTHQDSTESLDSNLDPVLEEHPGEYPMEKLSPGFLRNISTETESSETAERPDSTNGRRSTIGSDRHVTDEQYAAVHTLSSEIYRSHFSDNLVDMKLLCVEDRGLVISANVFAARANGGVKGNINIIS